jgi:hypothetical protein
MLDIPINSAYYFKHKVHTDKGEPIMATIQEQYAELIKQGQEASQAAIETWTQTVQQAFGQLSGSGLIGPDQVIDQVFDFAGNVLNAQRELAKQLVATSTAAAEQVRDGVSPSAENAYQG